MMQKLPTCGNYYGSVPKNNSISQNQLPKRPLGIGHNVVMNSFIF